MWEESYATPEYVFGRDPAPFVADNMDLFAPGDRVLCIADGEGRNSVHLARAGVTVTAFDLSPSAVKKAQKLAAEAGVSVECHVSTLKSWDWSRRFDTVLGVFIQFTPQAQQAAVFADFARAVHPGGRLVLHGFTPDQVELGTGGPSDPGNMYTTEKLRGFLPGWKVEHAREYRAEQHSGARHSGICALIDFVARKPV
ncbi:MAG: SAM-dependent methyltransferase [Rhodobacterales bacterium]|nr:MAG: SAM-dependent methyltransferase [Rhodobacterales bacterium]